MRQGFKRFWLLVVNDSWLCFLLAGYIAGGLFFLPAAAAALLLLVMLEPVRSGCRLQAVTRDLTQNFYAYRTWGGVWFITQKKPQGKTCRQNRQSFLIDRMQIQAGFPEGRYRALTHETVIRQLRRCPGITEWRQRPAYQADMRTILMSMSGGKCRRCAARCRAFRAAPRQFYLIEFRIGRADP